MSTIKQLFNEAESYRTPESRALGLKELCDKMAYLAGWHTEYTPSNRSKVKDKVKYDRAFDNILFCELLCRYKKPILVQFNRTNSLNHEKTLDKIYDVVLRFMHTYNPEKTVCNAQITSRMSLSIRQRAIECNFESYTKFNTDSTNVFIKDAEGIIIGRKYKDSKKGIQYEVLDSTYTLDQLKELSKNLKTPTPDWRCHKEVSLDAPIATNNSGDSQTLGDVLYSSTRSPHDLVEEEDTIECLEKRYTSNETQKVFFRLLLELGSKASPKKLLDEYIAETSADPEKAKTEVFKFYKQLKKQLILDYNK